MSLTPPHTHTHLVWASHAAPPGSQTARRGRRGRAAHSSPRGGAAAHGLTPPAAGGGGSVAPGCARPRGRGGAGRLLCGAGGAERRHVRGPGAAQRPRAARRGARGASCRGGAEGQSRGGPQPALAAASQRLLPTQVPAGPRLQPGAGLEGKGGRAAWGEGRAHPASLLDSLPGAGTEAGPRRGWAGLG